MNPGPTQEQSAAAVSSEDLVQVAGLPDSTEQIPGHSGIGRDEALAALVNAVRERHGAATAAVLFYGSCLRSGDPAAGIADFYVVVRSYRRAGMGLFAACANWLLPPNVFYLEAPLRGHTLRAKYAIVREDQFVRGCSGGWILPYLWGRFAQPSHVAWAADQATMAKMAHCLVAARQVFLQRCTAALEGRFNTAELWQEALLMSYRTELRAEQKDKIRSLVEADPEYYAQHTPEDLAQLPWVSALNSEADDSVPLMYQQWFQLSPSQLPQAQRQWRLRQLLGKLTSILRLFKSLFTFAGAVDYAIWKIQRHSGRRVDVPDWARRYPWIGGWVVLWRLKRSGQLK